MPLGFSVEDGTGQLNATSYVSVEDADDILSVNIHVAPKWMALSVDERESLLSWATRYLDSSVRWHGKKVHSEGALRWPRSNVRDMDNYEIASNEIPRQLKIATAEMARYLIDEDRSVEREQDGLKSLRADVIELEFAEDYRLPTIPSYMNQLLYGLGVVQTGKPRFARIIR